MLRISERLKKSWKETAILYVARRTKLKRSFSKLSKRITRRKVKKVGEIGIGAMVNWESQGATQFTDPKKITGFSDDGSYAFVEGGKTGIPTNQLVLVEPAPVKTRSYDGLKIALQVVAWGALIGTAGWYAARGSIGTVSWFKGFHMSTPHLPWLWMGRIGAAIAIAVVIWFIVRFWPKGKMPSFQSILGWAVVVWFVWLVYSNYQEIQHDQRAARIKAFVAIQKERYIIAQARLHGTELGEEYADFIYTVRPGAPAFFTKPESYCLYTKAVHSSDAYSVETKYGKILDSPVNRNNPIPGFVGYFELESAEGQVTEVHVWSYPQVRGTCKDPTRSGA